MPNHRFFGELFLQQPCGFYAGIDTQYIGEFHADDENRVKNSDSTVVNVRTGWEKAIGTWLLTPFFGVQNLLNEDYNNNVRINAGGGRYFEPAPGLNFYAGLSVRYRW